MIRTTPLQPPLATAFHDLERTLEVRRFQQLDPVVRLEIAAIAVLIAAFCFWQLRAPFDGIADTAGPMLAARALALRLAALLVLAAAAAGGRYPPRLRRPPRAGGGAEAAVVGLPVPPPGGAGPPARGGRRARAGAGRPRRPAVAGAVAQGSPAHTPAHAGPGPGASDARDDGAVRAGVASPDRSRPGADRGVRPRAGRGGAAGGMADRARWRRPVRGAARAPDRCHPGVVGAPRRGGPGRRRARGPPGARGARTGTAGAARIPGVDRAGRSHPGRARDAARPQP